MLKLTAAQRAAWRLRYGPDGVILRPVADVARALGVRPRSVLRRLANARARQT